MCHYLRAMAITPRERFNGLIIRAITTVTAGYDVVIEVSRRMDRFDWEYVVTFSDSPDPRWLDGCARHDVWDRVLITKYSEKTIGGMKNVINNMLDYYDKEDYINSHLYEDY